MSEIRKLSENIDLNDNTHYAYSNCLEENLNQIPFNNDYKITASLDSNIIQQVQNQLFDSRNWPCLVTDLKDCISNDGFITDSQHWKHFFENLKKAAFLQEQLRDSQKQEDPFATYARLYDEVIGQPCLDGFIGSYFEFILNQQNPANENRRDLKFLSIGCGTGLMEAHLIRHHDFDKENLLGTDLSAPMVQVAKNRIQAQVANVLKLEELNRKWDMTFTGLNVLQYLTPENMDKAIEVISRITQKDGLFFGDFITPDHIRCYPNFIQSESQNIISLRIPKLLETENKIYQQSEIINLHKGNDTISITYEGKHLRYLPSMLRIRKAFEDSFSGAVTLYDAVTLAPIPLEADTCPSTRYLVVAHK